MRERRAKTGLVAPHDLKAHGEIYRFVSWRFTQVSASSLCLYMNEKGGATDWANHSAEWLLGDAT